jgi:T4 RnlA family RNA ligase
MFNENVEYNMYLPTYEECLEIVNSNPEMFFYETKTNIDGYNISLFNYMLSPWQKFKTPIESKPNVTADELRGICFIFDTNGSLSNRYILMNKFWNVNQIPDTMYHVIKDYKIKDVMNKEDGSISSFVRLPNGKVIAKSKMSFISEQAEAMNRIYNSNDDIKRFVDWSLDNDIVAIFEYVSPRNKIVLDYIKDDLILLRLRNNNTGEYLNINDYQDKLDGITVAEFEEGKTLDELVELSKVVTNKEGWVIGFHNGVMVKLKSDWYSERHRLFTHLLNRENDVIKLILDNQMDDVISQLGEEDKSKREFVDDIENTLNRYISRTYVEVKKILADYNGDRKVFALHYRRNPLFGLCMTIINKNVDIIESIKEMVKDHTKHLQQARAWLDRHKEKV